MLPHALDVVANHRNRPRKGTLQIIEGDFEFIFPQSARPLFLSKNPDSKKIDSIVLVFEVEFEATVALFRKRGGEISRNPEPARAFQQRAAGPGWLFDILCDVRLGFEPAPSEKFAPKFVE